ncbi:MAG: peptide deformylase [Candidatus Cloacimonadota bacterium]|nr:peptide deformylase [Candidatus Cloacimonadota bacterium]
MRKNNYKPRILPIRIYGDKVLRLTAKPVEKFTIEIKNFIKDLVKTMYVSDGVGLSAPQVGRSLRIFVIDNEWVQKGEKRNPKVFVNPQIIKMDSEAVNEEGCLSLPEIFDKVRRSEYIEIEALDENGKKVNYKTDGLLCRAIQHENDHLDGILFIDHLPKLKLLTHKLKLKSISKTTDEFGVNRRYVD